MKSVQTLLLAATLSAGLFAAASANANLVVSADGNTVYDTDLNITWAANANLAATNAFGLATGVNLGTDIYGYQSIIYSNGTMTWGGAQKWIGAMNTANYLGYHDWRLPTTTDTGTSGCNYSTNGTDCGFNSTGSEMSHLYYTELGDKGYINTAGVAQAGYGLVNKGPFTNFQPNDYWFGTEYAPSPNGAWTFDTYFGGQGFNYKNGSAFALAVRPGQVAAVPVPAAAWLLGSGLISLVGVARRKEV